MIRSSAGRVIVAITIMFIAAGCGSTASSSPPAPSGSSGSSHLQSLLPAALRSSGQLRDLVNAPYPPQEFYSSPGGPLVGFDISLARALAGELGLTLKLTNTPNFAELIPAVQTDRTDIVLSSVYDLHSRQDVVHFVDYFRTGTQFMGLNSTSSKLSTYADLCGKTVAVQTGTAYAQEITTLSKSVCKGGQSIKVVSVATPPDTEIQVKIGRAIAIAQGPEADAYLANQQEPGKWHVIGQPFDQVDYGIIFSKSDPQLGMALTAALNALISNGTYQRILGQWHLSGDGVTTATIDGSTSG